MALIVVLGHLRNAIFLDFRELDRSSIATTIFYAFTSSGELAVVVFFVISGFLVTSSFKRDLEKHDFFAKASVAYLAKRSIRLFIVFVPAMIVAALPFVFHVLNTGSWEQISENWGSGTLNPRNLGLGSYLATFILSPGLFGREAWFGLAPSWSLVNEYWYYITLPPVFYLLLNLRVLWLPNRFHAISSDLRFFCVGIRQRLFIAVGIIAILICIQSTLGVLSDFYLWIIGALLAVLPRSSSQNSALDQSIDDGWCIPISLLFAASLPVFSFFFPLLDSALVASLCALIISRSLFNVSFIRFPFFYSFLQGVLGRPLAWISRISFSLYLCHWIVLVYISCWFPALLQGTALPGLSAFFIFFLLFVISLILACLFYILFEKKYYDLARFFRLA